VQLWAILDAAQVFLPLSIDEFVSDSEQKYWINSANGSTFVEVVGGTQGKRYIFAYFTGVNVTRFSCESSFS
jgi:hypothetical protein